MTSLSSSTPNMIRLSLLLRLLTVAASEITDYTQYVNVFTGISGGGNDFPGVTRPFGMVKIGADLYDGVSDAYSGYLSTGNFSGFSLMHEQGTGGAPKYGTVAQLPLVGNVPNPLSRITVGRAVTDQASVGYYRAQTSQNVVVEMAATPKTGIYQYTFPVGTHNHILVDVSHVLPSFRGLGLSQGYAGGSFETFADGHYETSGIYNNGWNRSPDWTIYSCGYFNETAQSKVYTAIEGGPSIQTNGSAVSNSTSLYVGGLFTFTSTSVSSRVGISWISKEQACQNVNSEIPKGTDFETVVQGTKDAWNTEILSKFESTTTNATNLELLYTSLYFMNLLPTNQTGENPSSGGNPTEPYYSDIFTLWDTHRCATSLFQIVHPTAYEEFIRSLINIWRFEGFMPDARSSNYNGRTQGGSNADNVLADAYVKGVRGDVNWDDGYAAMVTDAEVQPPNNNDPQAPDSSTKEGRGALPDWLAYGFITPTYTRAVSRAVEYAWNDFSLHQVANGLGKTVDAAKYLARSRNWKNHWNSNITSLGFTGFVSPRNLTSFISIDPTANNGYWGDPTYEATSWSYSWADVHDAYTLVNLTGGAERFLARLEAMFTVGFNPATPSSILFDATNEPTFQVPYLFNFVNRQDRSVYHSRNIAKSSYKLGPAGLPGNSDAGAMQTWLLWNMIGLYPIVGQTTFLIHSPWYESLTINLGGDKKLVITSTGGDGNGDARYYVQSLKVNGTPWTKNWLTWEDVFANGGTMEYVLGSQAVQWDTGPLPPSPAS